MAIDRAAAIARLRAGWMEGLLSLDTFEQRLARVERAQTGAELARLVSDIVLRPVTTRFQRLRDSVRRGGNVRSEARIAVLLPAPGMALVVGRHPTCDVILPDPAVSRRHLHIYALEDGWLARDLGSANGSWLGEARLGRARVDPGDEIMLGETLVLLR